MPSNVLVIVVDGLRASSLGAYGNTSFATPALDRFAAESLLLDWCYAPSPDLHQIYEAMWRSHHDAQNHATVSVARILADAGYSARLVTDEVSLSSFPTASAFDEIFQLASVSETAPITKRANDSSETCLARVFSAATELVDGIRDSDKPLLVWLHAVGMYGPWDAPLELQESLLDEDNPSPISSIVPPDINMGLGVDPDAAFRYACAYAAQVMVLDECLAGLINATNTSAENEWLITFVGARGFPLGEHGRIGGVDPRTHAEQLHVPWLVRFPDGVGRLTRVAGLTSHHDLLPTLVDWIDRDRKFDRSTFEGTSIAPFLSSARTPWRNATLSRSVSAQSIRTAAWCLRESVPRHEGSATSDDVATPSELYVRPDDRWEANDIAKLCPDVVEELRALASTC
jgi:arylsulfatase A-like enzyme